MDTRISRCRSYDVHDAWSHAWLGMLAVHAPGTRYTTHGITIQVQEIDVPEPKEGQALIKMIVR